MKKYYTSLIILILCFFDAVALKVPEIQTLRQRPDTIGLYQKFEVSFNINNGNEYTNPFDPEEVDISAVFISPSGKKWTIPGFYYYSAGTLWKVRFSPDEEGVWNYTVSVKDKGGETTTPSMKFVAFSLAFFCCAGDSTEV